MDQPRELVSRLADHVTAMANIVTYEDAAAASAQSLIDFLPVDTVAQVRLQTDGAIIVGETRGPLSEVLAALPFERLFEMPHLPVPGAVWQRHVSENSPLGTFERTLADAGAQTVIVSGLNGNGRLRGLLVLTSRERVSLSAEDQRVLELLGSLTVSVLRSTMLVASLRRHAVTDPLTGLWHRGAFNEAMIVHRESDRHALILVDIDHFKQCNDTKGHVEGDRVLQVVANAMSSVLRTTDSVFRIGGDEFAAIVEVPDAAAALDMGERMHSAVADSDAGITISVGVALGDPGENEIALRDRADAVLYRVKAEGRDGVAIDRRDPGASTFHVAA
jgi:diguanylate cyclase (GGDEF)-like protein